MLECVINISEGCRREVIEAIADSGDEQTIDVHSDCAHNRSVITLAGADLLNAALNVARATAAHLDIAEHRGAHPRLGAIDVVPFVPYGQVSSGTEVELSDALAARELFAKTVAEELELPCFYYGPERSLPDVRRGAFETLVPDAGPPRPHPRLGACCVGARPVLVAFNCWMKDADLLRARSVVTAIRSPDLRCLAFELEGAVQISCNLVAPWRIGPAEAFDAVAEHLAIERTELVGLIPQAILERIPKARWHELDLAEAKTIESRLSRPRPVREARWELRSG